MRFRFQYRRYRLPFRVTVRTAHGLWVEREGILVRLEDAGDDARGTVSFGEAAPIPWFGTETVAGVEEGCRALGEWIEDTAFQQVPKELRTLRCALASARGEQRGAGDDDDENDGARRGSFSSNGRRARPFHRTLSVAALLPAGRAAVAQIGPKAEIGFRVFKWKVGVGALADELALLDDVCAELPSGAKLRLDANGAWERRQAERWLERCADRPVEFIEQPIAPGARGADDLLLGLAGDYPTPIALDESLVGDDDVEKWLAAGWPGVFVVKPSLFGDPETTLARLERGNARVVFSAALETAVGARAALRLAFAWKGERVAVKAKEALKTDAGNVEPEAESWRPRALGFGVWPLFADPKFDGPAAAPFIRYDDVERLDAESLWNALS